MKDIIGVDLSLDVREYARRIQSPALLITAARDQIVPSAYSENLIPGAKTIELDSGHLIFLEKPVELASAILTFCNGKQAPSQSSAWQRPSATVELCA